MTMAVIYFIRLRKPGEIKLFMFGLRHFLKRLQGGKTQGTAQERSSEAVRLAFTNRYLNFKTLLSTNNKVLEIITDMEQALVGSRSFGMSFIRANCTAISVNMYKIIKTLNEITAGRHKELFEVFEDIWVKIDKKLKSKKTTAGGAWVFPLEAVNKEMADQVGSKMANVGEVKNQIGLPVPEGFVITAAAYEHFLEHSRLQDEINRRIQFLEPDNIAQLHETSAEIQKLIINAPLPPELEEAIRQAYQDLTKKLGRGINVSMRSSAIGEDTKEASFAGQYRSMLNVSPEYLILSYKEILASKYSVPAIAYRLNKGFRDEDIIMCVGCMAMVEAKAGGVMYSADPADIRHDCIIINAVWGLGKPVVDGSVAPDLFVLSKEDPKIILKKEVRPKEQKFVCYAEEGICRMELVEEEKDTPAISDDQAGAMAELALRLEKYFGGPQDIEWAIDPDGSIRILQSRPLMVLSQEGVRPGETVETEVELPLTLEGGVTASPGVASGPAFVVKTSVDMLQFPRGSVLVAMNPLPQWAAILSSAVAVVTDRGGVTGHLAAVAREFKIPALLGTSTATRDIHNGNLITVDADGHRIYAGRAESLLQKAAEKVSLMKGSPVYTTLEKVLKHIAPLNLTDPDAANFTPKGCQTIHDITRFAHEMSLRELFDYKKEVSFPEHLAKRLVFDVPMQWWVIDLDGGLKKEGGENTVRLEDIACVPMLALWKGITAVPWGGPPPVDARGFLSIMYEATMDSGLEPSMGSRFAERNYFIISRNFCHLSSRFGFHFSTVEAFLSDRVAENYICFNFKGGAADRTRKGRRAKLIKTILEKFDFWVQIKGDLIFARLERQEQDFLKQKLTVLGHLIMHTRQLDMILSDSGRVNWYVEEMLKQISTFAAIRQ